MAWGRVQWSAHRYTVLPPPGSAKGHSGPLYGPNLPHGAADVPASLRLGTTLATPLPKTADQLYICVYSMC